MVIDTKHENAVKVEEWKEVLGYEDYFTVSSEGRLHGKRSGRLLKWTETSSGYLAHTTRIGGRSGKCIMLLAHRLVASAFIPNPNGKPQVNHIDGDKTDNSVQNLEWCTGKENMTHASEKGLLNIHSGSANKKSKLSEESIDEIMAVYVKGSKDFGCRALAEVFGVHHTQISRVVRGLRKP